MALEVLILDVDGTLAETEEAHRLAFNEAFAEHGTGWEWEAPLYRRLLTVTGGKERLRHYVETCRPPLPAGADLDRLVAAIHRDKTAAYVRRVEAAEVPLRPGIARLIGEARTAGIRLAVATTTSRVNVTSLLASTLGPDAVGWFAALGCGEDAARKKPAPDVYLAVLQRLGAPPESCLAIEDSANGLRAALAAGIPTVITVSVYTEGEDFTGARAVAPDLGGVDLARLRRWHAEAPAALPA